MLIEKVKYYQYIIEEALKERLSDELFFRELLPVIRYSVFPAGKRIRPLLSMMLNCEWGGEAQAFGGVASAIELLHCSSLIHDNLPGLDNDDLRRGRASCHKQFDEASAILAGDMMISYAASLISESDYAADIRVKAVSELMNAFSLICVGQKMDVLKGECRPALYEIHQRKTGALFGATFALAAICAGFSESFVGLARNTGVQFGVCFQLLDDFIDVYGSDQERGRSGSSDEKKEKQTFFAGVPLEDGKHEWQKCLKKLEVEFSELEMAKVELPFTRAYIMQFLSRSELK